VVLSLLSRQGKCLLMDRDNSCSCRSGDIEISDSLRSGNFDTCIACPVAQV